MTPLPQVWRRTPGRDSFSTVAARRFDRNARFAWNRFMTKTTATTADASKTTHTYRVVVEPDEDAWHAWCPALQGYGAATWGATRAEAPRQIREVVAMVVAEPIEEGETPSDRCDGQREARSFPSPYERDRLVAPARLHRCAQTRGALADASQPRS